MRGKKYHFDAHRYRDASSTFKRFKRRTSSPDSTSHKPVGPGRYLHASRSPFASNSSKRFGSNSFFRGRGNMMRDRAASGSRTRVNPSRLPYAVSPVRGEVELLDESLNKTELLRRLKAAKDNDNFDEMYYYRELLKELVSKGCKSIKLSHSKKDDSREQTPEDFDIGEMECIDTVDDEDHTAVDKEKEASECIEIHCSSPESTKSDEKIKRKVEQSTTTLKRIHQPDYIGNPRESSRHKHKRSENEKERTLRNCKHSPKNFAHLSNGHSTKCNNNSQPKIHSTGESRNDDELFDDVDDEAAYLQFAEDNVDVEAMVRAAGSKSPTCVTEDELIDGVIDDNEIVDAELDLDNVDCLEELSVDIGMTSKHNLHHSKQRKNILKRYMMILNSKGLTMDGDTVSFTSLMGIFTRALVSALQKNSNKTSNANEAIISELLRWTNCQLRRPSTAIDNKVNIPHSSLIRHSDSDINNLPVSNNNFTRTVGETSANFMQSTIPCLAEVCLTNFIDYILQCFNNSTKQSLP